MMDKHRENEKVTGEHPDTQRSAAVNSFPAPQQKMKGGYFKGGEKKQNGYKKNS